MTYKAEEKKNPSSFNFMFCFLRTFADRLNGEDEESSNTVVAMDLGGGSTQISFVPSKNDEIIPGQSQYVSKIGIFEKNLNVYSRR